MNYGSRLYRLPSGEKYTPLLAEIGGRATLKETPGGHARMVRVGGVLYLAMRHGHGFPSGLTVMDRERAAALGWVFGDDPAGNFNWQDCPPRTA